MEHALALMNRSLAIREDAYGKDHPQVAGALLNLSNIYSDLEDLEKAFSLASRARPLR